MERSKESVARRLAEAHFAIETGLVRIVRLLAAPSQEADPKEPLKLLEVNQDTTADGIIPLFFGPHAASGIPYPSVIVEVTPDEYEQIRRNPSMLPNHWTLGEEFPKTSTAVAGG